jgi:hypothetical protein
VAYEYDAELTTKSVRNLYILPPLLIGAAIYSAWLANVARRTHTEISFGQGKPNIPWFEGYALAVGFVIAAVVVVWAARVSARRLREQERRQRE